MGLPMAQNLVTRGHQLVLYDISPGRVERGGGCGESGRGGSTSPDRHHDAALGEEPDGLLCRGRRYTQVGRNTHTLYIRTSSLSHISLG